MTGHPIPLLPVMIDTATLPPETWGAPDRGTLSWRTLFSAGRTETEALVCGVAEITPGQHFAAHRHAEPEVYFGISGAADVIIDGVAHRLSPGMALFIPGNAEHGIPLATETCRWFYTFARDSFDQITYHFTHEGAASAPAEQQ